MTDYLAALKKIRRKIALMIEGDYAGQIAVLLIMKAVFLNFLRKNQKKQRGGIFKINEAHIFKYTLIYLAKLISFGNLKKIGSTVLETKEPLDEALNDFSNVRSHLKPIILKLLLEIDSLSYNFFKTDSFKSKEQTFLGDVYEELTPQNEKKSAGQFYTPPFIADYILERTLYEADVLENPFVQILDPACGCGHFLLRAYDFLKNEFKEKLPRLRERYRHDNYELIAFSGEIITIKGEAYWRKENLHYHILSNCLFGADINGFSAQLTLSLLIIKDKSAFLPKDNIIVCDSLFRWENEIDPVHLKEKSFWSKKYDYIITNPPYVSFGLKGVSKLNKEEAGYLRKNYPNSAQYKISYYALFFERAIELLPAGGKLGFITPDSFLLGRYFSKIRRYILDNCLVNEFTLLRRPVFAASVGFAVVSVFTKSTAQSAESHLVQAGIWRKDEEIFSYKYPQNYFLRQAYFRFRLFFSEKDKAIIDKMDASGNDMVNFANIKTGMRSLTRQKDIISGRQAGAYFKRGLVSSAEVKRFQIAYQGNWLNTDPLKLNKGGWDKNIIENKKILIRQTGSSLIASIDENGLYHLNNVHSISIKGEYPLEFIECLLNSVLLNYYYQTVSLEAGRPMAQTDIETLEKLPLPDKANGQQIAKLSAIAQKLKKYLDMLSNQNKSALRKNALIKLIERSFAKLNKIVYQLYNLTENEVRHIENRCADLKKQTSF